MRCRCPSGTGRRGRKADFAASFGGSTWMEWRHSVARSGTSALQTVLRTGIIPAAGGWRPVVLDRLAHRPRRTPGQTHAPGPRHPPRARGRAPSKQSCGPELFPPQAAGVRSSSTGWRIARAPRPDKPTRLARAPRPALGDERPPSSPADRNYSGRRRLESGRPRPAGASSAPHARKNPRAWPAPPAPRSGTSALQAVLRTGIIPAAGGWRPVVLDRGAHRPRRTPGKTPRAWPAPPAPRSGTSGLQTVLRTGIISPAAADFGSALALNQSPITNHAQLSTLNAPRTVARACSTSCQVGMESAAPGRVVDSEAAAQARRRASGSASWRMRPARK